MKKLILLFIVLIGIITPVEAANYEMRELIPIGVTTTIRGEKLLYKNLVYQNGFINFEEIKNNSNDSKALSISIGIFDSKKKNIGTVNYCSKDLTLSSKEELKGFMIDIKGSNLEEGKTYSDIKYIAVLSENDTCRIDGTNDFLGQTVEEIGIAKNTSISDSARMLLTILEVIVGIGVVLFVYRFLFTSAYRNIDGEDVRQEYAYINKQLEKERERKAKTEKPVPKVVKTHKTQEIIEQEKIQNEKDLLDDSDLHNFYK